MLRHYHNAYEQYRGGMMTADPWEALALPMARLLSDRDGSEAWAIMAPAFAPPFRARVDERVRRRPTGRRAATQALADGRAAPACDAPRSLSEV